ncbi:MAG: DUF1836 domain-containing protein [Clostridia bacterium]|nr:DUF1836 domain-containing protein [Clostridia bacterium]
MNLKKSELLKIHLPRWEEFPAFELYVDQVIAFICEKLEPFNFNSEEPLLTQSMINNYVKNGVLNPPVKKKYNKTHLAKLVVICICKRMLPLSYISDAITVMSRVFDIEEGYNLICDEIEYEIKSTVAPTEFPPRAIDDTPARKVALMRSLASAVAKILFFDTLIQQRRRLSNVVKNIK